MIKIDRESLGRTSFLNLFGNGLRVILSLLTSILASRGLGTEKFGLANLIIGYTAFLNYLLTLGFDLSLPYFVAKYRAGNDTQMVRSVSGFGIRTSGAVAVATTALCAAGSWLHLRETPNEQLLWPIIAFLVQSLFWTQGSVFTGFLRGSKHFIPGILREQILFPASQLLGVVVLVRLAGLNVLGFALSYALASIVGFIHVAYAASLEFKTLKAAGEPVAPTRLPVWEWLKFSFPLCIMTSLEPMLTWVSVITAGISIPASDIGIMSVCLRLTVFVQFLFMALNPIVSSYLADLFHSRRNDEFGRLYQTVNVWSSKWAIAVSFLLVSISDYALKIFGAEYVYGTVALAVIIPGSAIEGCFGSAKQTLVMLGRNKINAADLVAAIVLNAGLTALLAPKFGIIGAGVAFSTSFIVLNLMRLIQVYRTVGIAPFTRANLRSLGVQFVVTAALAALLKASHLSGDTRLALSLLTFFVIISLVFWEDRGFLLGNSNKDPS